MKLRFRFFFPLQKKPAVNASIYRRSFSNIRILRPYRFCVISLDRQWEIRVWRESKLSIFFYICCLAERSWIFAKQLSILNFIMYEFPQNNIHKLLEFAYTVVAEWNIDKTFNMNVGYYMLNYGIQVKWFFIAKSTLKQPDKNTSSWHVLPLEG